MNKMEFSSVDDVLDFAIASEVAAYEFYLTLASKTKNAATKVAFEKFADEELKHKAKLEDIKKTGILPSSEHVSDLKIFDYVVADEPHDNMDYQDALILAMKKEKAAFRLYNQLAAATKDESLRQVLLAFAQEEAKHKLQFEIEYDEAILTEN